MAIIHTGMTLCQNICKKFRKIKMAQMLCNSIV